MDTKMKNLSYIFFFLIACCKAAANDDLSLEMKCGNYYFLDKTMNKIFTCPNVNFHAQIDFQILGPFIIFFDSGFLRSSGYTAYRFSDDITGIYYDVSKQVKINVNSASLGLKYMFFLNDYMDLFGSVASTLYDVHVVNESMFIPRVDKYKNVGGFLETGVRLKPILNKPNVFIDVFSDCCWASLKTREKKNGSCPHNINMSGVNIGVGFGVKF